MDVGKQSSLHAPYMFPYMACCFDNQENIKNHVGM